MNIKQLEYFIEICNTMNFTKAANHLNISQTAITKQIHLLEDELNVALFDRNSKKIKLTGAGAFLYKEALETCQRFNQTQANMKSFINGERGIIKVGFLKEINVKRLIKCILLFKKEYPFINLELFALSNKQLYTKLDNGELDCIIAITPQNNIQYKDILIKKYPLIVIMNKNDLLANEENIDVSSLRPIRFDMRKAENYDDIKSELIRIACYNGYAVIYNFLDFKQYNDFLISKPVSSNDYLSLSLVYDTYNHFKIIEKFVETMQYEFY